VIHAAGTVRGGGVAAIDALDRTACELQFQSKVTGTYVLQQATAALPLDFVLLTSSLSAILGGLGYGAYAAANQFLDAFAEEEAAVRGTRWISANLDGWTFDDAGPRTALSELEMQPAEGVESLVRILASGSITRVAVSTADLSARVDRYVRKSAAGEGASRSGSSLDGTHARPDLAVAYVEPSNELEQAICDIWKGLLGLERVGVHDDFFELGGHSLLATQLASRLRHAFEINVKLADLFEAPTVSGLAELFMVRLLEQEEQGVAEQP
jgi:phthiocerol/phenolphthiocerol synthesis type-I polyketide synthase E